MDTNEKIKIFKNLFKGRIDAYGAGAGQCIKEKLADKVFLAHLQGKRRIGVYPMSMHILNGKGTYWGCIDYDDGRLDVILEILAKMDPLGVNAYIEQSSGINHPNGIHIWVFFTEPVEAIKARALLMYVGSGYEIFPKQAFVSDSQYGNYVNLPLFGNSVKEKKTVFLDPANNFEPYQDQWDFLKSIQKITPQQLDDLIESGELEPGKDIAAEPETVQTQGVDYGDMLPCVSAMMRGVSEGCRDEVCFTLAKHWRVEKKLSELATLGIMKEWNSRNKPQMKEKDIAVKVKSAYSGHGGSGYTSFGCENDLIKPFCNKEICPIFKEHKKEKYKTTKEDILPGYFRKNAFLPPRLADELMTEFSFIYAGEQMYIYIDGVYRPIGNDFIMKICRERLKDEARISHVNEVIAHIRDMNRVGSELLNPNKDLINLNNGMFDWQTGELIDHDKGCLSTIRIPVSYNARSQINAIGDFFKAVVDPECLDLVAEMFGYCTIPDTSFHKAFMLTGSGSNGKSTLLSLMECFIGTDNTAKVPLQEICDNRFKRAEIYGKLVNIFADLDDKGLQSTSYFKTIVSGDAIDAERKNRDPFFFRPYSRLLYSANEIPKSPDRSFAYYRRWCIIPFSNTFTPGVNEDKNIIEKITPEHELSGLLNFAINGLKRLHNQQVFTEPEPVKQALSEYMKANDTVEAFISDCCDLGLEYSIERQKFYNAYSQYCTKEDYESVTRNLFYNKVRGKPGIREHRTPEERLFIGIKCKDTI